MKLIIPALFLTVIISACSKSSNYVNNPDAPDHLHNRAVGASANDILSANKYTSVKIEVQYMAGVEPDAGALVHLQNMMSAIVNKPGGVSISTREIPGTANLTLSVDDIISIERNNRTAFTNGSELALYMLYTNGAYIEPNVLGIAYKNTSVALFGKK